MNKKIISVLSLAALLTLGACASVKGTEMTADDITSAIGALDETHDLEYTYEEQTSTKEYYIYEAIYKGYETQAAAAYEVESLASLDYIYKAEATQTKHTNYTIHAHSTAAYYYCDDPKTATEGSEVDEVIYVNSEGAYVDAIYYGEGSEDNFAYSMPKEYASLYYDCESWEAWFATWGYGGNGDALSYYGFYTDAEDYPNTVVTGTKYSNGTTKIDLTIVAEATISDIVSGSFNYDTKVVDEFVYSFTIGKNGDVTEETSTDSYYLYGSPVDGTAFDEPVLMYKSTLFTGNFSKKNQGEYKGDYHTDIALYEF